MSVMFLILWLTTSVCFGFSLNSIIREKPNGPKLQMVSSIASAEGWDPSSWSEKDVKYMPNYEGNDGFNEEISKIERCSPLVFAGEVRTLHENLARSSQGQGFLLVGDDNEEMFKVDNVRDTFRVILQMALVLTFGSSMPVIKVGRLGNQFSALDEKSGDSKSLNLLEEYNRSAQTLNILRAFSTGGYADISRLHAWNLDFVDQTDEGSRYRKFAAKVDESLRFMKACGVDTSASSFKKTDFFTANDCVFLPYEQALTREDSTTGRWYDCSAHMTWIPENARQLDGAHLEFCRGLGNPLGIRITDKCSPEELIRVIETVNPQNIPGRITVVVCMGDGKLRKNLPGLIRAVQREGKSVLWVSDPSHAVKAKEYGSNAFEKIRDELRAFFDVHDEMGSHPGGVHLAMTGEDVMECTGGFSGADEGLAGPLGYPRLNSVQALELAFLIAERMRLRTGLPPIE